MKTDHKALVYAFNQKSSKASPRQLRQLDFIGQFTTRIIHIAGTDNTVADALSRIEAIDMPVITTTEELAQAQTNDMKLEELLKPKASSLQLKKLRIDNTDNVVYCDTSGTDVRPYVSSSLRRRIFNATHNLVHPSGRTTSKLISKSFVWPNLNKDVTEWAKTCLHCQRSKIHKHNRNTLERIDIPLVFIRYTSISSDHCHHKKTCNTA